MVECPRCRKKMYHNGTDISSSSSLSDEPTSNFFSAYKCWYCGTMKFVELPVAMPLVPETPQALARPSGPRTVENTSQARGLAIRAGVALHIERIRYLYSLGVNGSIVCKMLVDNGVYASEKTLRKHVRELLAE